MATKTVHITGTFKDVSDRPLIGSIIFTAQPEYIVNRAEDILYSGEIEYTLDETGNLDATLLVTETEWKYKVRFNLSTVDRRTVAIEDTYVHLPTDGALPDYLIINATPGTTTPRLLFATDEENQTIDVTGAQINPDDEGSILIPTTG